MADLKEKQAVLAGRWEEPFDGDIPVYVQILKELETQFKGKVSTDK